MAGNDDQWAALDSQHERLVDSLPMPVIEDPAGKRKRRHRRMAIAAAGGGLSLRSRSGRGRRPQA